jgi:hypothetical protein
MVTRPDEAANANASASACPTSTSTVRDPDESAVLVDSTVPVTTGGAVPGSDPDGGDSTIRAQLPRVLL